jgi:cell division protein FtsA
VLTGGGAQLKHIQQITSYITGKETRIGYPNEHLSSETPDDIKLPLYATGVGLVIDGVRDARKARLFRKNKPDEEPSKEALREEEKKEGRKKASVSQLFLQKIIKFFEEEEKRQE